MAKEGSTIGGLMDCFGTAVSMSLQYGVPLEVYVNKFSHTRFEPMGFTKNPDIKIAKSMVDYIFRWLGITFLPGFREANKMVPPSPTIRRIPEPGRRTPKQSFGPPPRRPAGQMRPKDRRTTAERIGQGLRQRPFRPEASGRAERLAGRRLKELAGGQSCSARWGRHPVCRRRHWPKPTSPRRFRAASNSPPSKPTPQPATTAAPSPSATATATSATTAAAAWGVRSRKGGCMDALRRNDVIEMLGRHKADFAARYGITSLGVFGSVARDEADDQSDVDIVYETDSPNLFRTVRMKQAWRRFSAVV